MANHHFVHKETQFVVDSLLERQPVQVLECRRPVVEQLHERLSVTAPVLRREAQQGRSYNSPVAIAQVQ